MRTTVKIDDALLAEARVRAARGGRTLNAVIEDALREAFAAKVVGPAERPELPVFRGSRLMPGVDLDDSASLLDHMERIQP